MSTIQEEQVMGRVTVDIHLTNSDDIALARAGKITPAEIRTVTVAALVDTGATMLVLPKEVIQNLGLQAIRTTRSRIGDGRFIERTIYGPAKLKVMDREVICEAADSPPNVPPLLGQIPLESLDLHVDCKGQRLIPNPESPDMTLIDVL